LRASRPLRARYRRVWFDQREIDDFAAITERSAPGSRPPKALLAWYSADDPASRPSQMVAMGEPNPMVAIGFVDERHDRAKEESA
jgi:hypothetical protein